MFRKLFLTVAVAAFAAPVVLADDEKKTDDKAEKKGKLAGKVDKSKMFDMMDANTDGKLSKDEFKTGMEKVAEKLKEKAADKGGKAAGALEKIGDKLGEKMFDKLDADKDGSVSKEEFEKGEFDPTNLKSLRDKVGKGK